MLLRMLPGVSNNGRCTDDEQPSEIAIPLLGDAAKPFLAPPSNAAAVEVQNRYVASASGRASPTARQGSQSRVQRAPDKPNSPVTHTRFTL